MAEPAAPPTFDKLMTQLETIVKQLESNELSLEAALDAYQSGIELAREGHRRLEGAEQRIEELLRGGATRPVDPRALLKDDDAGNTGRG